MTDKEEKEFISNPVEAYENVVKQLALKTQECEKLRGDFHDTNEQLKDYKEHHDKQSEEYQKLKQDLFLAQNQITLKNEYIQKVKQECEELKKQLETSEKWRIKAESSNEKLELRNTCYRKALEEIERYCSIKNDPDIQDVPYRIIAPTILNIINKAKGKQ